MSIGLPDEPPEGSEFTESLDDCSCPSCGWDRELASADLQKAYNSGIALAAQVENTPFTVMAGAQLICFYWRCPSCKTFFTTEEESHMGAMT